MKYALFLILFAILGCSKQEQEALLNTEWNIESLKMDGKSINKQNDVTLLLEGKNSFRLRLDVNSCFGTVEFLGGNKLKVTDIGCTEKCCDSEFSSNVVNALSGVFTFSLKGDKLTLEGKNTSVTFVKKKDNKTVNTPNATKDEAKNTLVSLRKTPCHGTCPVYEVRIDKNGKVLFDGQDFVAVKGKKYFQLSSKQFKTLHDKLAKTNFSSYKESYDEPRLMDVPSTFITYNNKQIKLRVWKDVPQELSDVSKYIESILVEKKFYGR